MKRGRKRKHDPSIPDGIDQAALPSGVYWDRTGNGRWYVFNTDVTGRTSRQTIADWRARLSDLHKIVEARAGINRGSLNWLLDQFHESPQFAALSSRTQDDYEAQRRITKALKLSTGTLGELTVARLTQPFFQRLIDKIGAVTPTKANHLHRYLRRVFHWGINRGHCAHNPAKGVEQAKERKQQRYPNDLSYHAVLSFAQGLGGYLPRMMEIGYLCRLRGVETRTLTDANVLKDGLLTNRTKNSRDNIVQWTPRLRAVVDEALAIRAKLWKKSGRVVPFDPGQRPLIVSRSGQPLSKTTVDTAWQKMIAAALKAGVITPEQRFSLHDLKRKGVTDTEGTRHEKQDASGHRSERMMDTYDKSVPIVKPSKDG